MTPSRAPPGRLSRRALLRGLPLAPRTIATIATIATIPTFPTIPSWPARAAHDPFGPLRPPLPVTPWWVKTDKGQEVPLRQLLEGRVTAVQLIFTRCRATCPIQAALFAQVSRAVRDRRARFLSLSIDPGADTPSVLRAWLDRFAAPPSWQAAAPRANDVDRMLDFFRGRAQGVDRHTAAVHLVDAQARLVFRTQELPTAAHVADVMKQVLAAR